jgi:hypothetical protein
MKDESLLPALQERYAKMLGELKACDERGEQLRAELSHMEAVIKIYRTDWTGEDVVPRRPSYHGRYVKIGRGTQTALQVLRDADEPLTIREIVVKVMDKLEIPITAGAVKSLDSTLRYTLGKKTSVVSVEGRYPKRFSIKPVGSS